MTTTEIFLIAMTIIFTIPYLIWRLGKTEYYAPLVVVQIITGILLGPGILGSVFPDYYALVFNQPVIQSLNGIAAMGMLMYDGWIGPKAMTWQFVLGIGMACAVTALPILILLMEKLEILRQPIGQRILRYVSIDDIAIWGVRALILLDWQRVGKQLGFLVGFAVVGYGLRKLMVWLPASDRWYVGLIWLAVCDFGADWSGLHFMVGAFLAGAIMDSHWFDQKQMDGLRHHVLWVVMPVFFLSTGLRTNWSLGGAAVFIVAGVLLLAAVAGKLMGTHLAGRILK